ncbi:hypothetical protein HDU99_002213, partial [Rhizoclosmatium hyalinum]
CSNNDHFAPRTTEKPEFRVPPSTSDSDDRHLIVSHSNSIGSIPCSDLLRIQQERSSLSYDDNDSCPPLIAPIPLYKNGNRAYSPQLSLLLQGDFSLKHTTVSKKK